MINKLKQKPTSIFTTTHFFNSFNNAQILWKVLKQWLMTFYQRISIVGLKYKPRQQFENLNHISKRQQHFPKYKTFHKTRRHFPKHNICVCVLENVVVFVKCCCALYFRATVDVPSTGILMIMVMVVQRTV